MLHNCTKAAKYRLLTWGILHNMICNAIPCTGLDRPWGFQEVQAPIFQDNRHIEMVRLSALRTSCLIPPPQKYPGNHCCCRSQWPRGLRRRSTAAHLLQSWVRIPPRAWMFVCCECCVLSGRGLCDGLIIRSEESYRLWRVVCDHETLQARRLKPARGL